MSTIFIAILLKTYASTFYIHEIKVFKLLSCVSASDGSCSCYDVKLSMKSTLENVTCSHHSLAQCVRVLWCVGTRKAYVKYNMTLAFTHFQFSNKQQSVYCICERRTCLNNLHKNPYIYLNSYFFILSSPNDAYTLTYIKRIDDNAQKYVVIHFTGESIMYIA